MSLVRIKLIGKGQKVTRGAINYDDYKKLKKNDIEKIWFNNLDEYIGKKWYEVKDNCDEIGLISGSVEVIVDGEELINITTNSLERLFINNKPLIELDWIDYQSCGNTVVTSELDIEGTLYDSSFIIDNEFDLSKIKFITKSIEDKNGSVGYDLFISEVWYDDTKLTLTNGDFDVKLSKIKIDSNYEK